MYFKSCRFDPEGEIFIQNRCRARGYEAMALDGFCSFVANLAVAARVHHQVIRHGKSQTIWSWHVYTFFCGRLVKDVFEEIFIICSTSLIMDVLHQLKWMLKVLKMMIKVMKLLFFCFLRITFPWCPRDPNRFARCLLRSLPVVKSRPRQNSAGAKVMLVSTQNIQNIDKEIRACLIFGIL